MYLQATSFSRWLRSPRSAAAGPNRAICTSGTSWRAVRIGRVVPTRDRTARTHRPSLAWLRPSSSVPLCTSREYVSRILVKGIDLCTCKVYIPSRYIGRQRWTAGPPRGWRSQRRCRCAGTPRVGSSRPNRTVAPAGWHRTRPRPPRSSEAKSCPRRVSSRSLAPAPTLSCGTSRASTSSQSRSLSVARPSTWTALL